MAIERTQPSYVSDEDGAAILDVEQGLISVLNPTGAYVWQGINRGEPIETIVANLSRDTGVELCIVRKDVRAFVATLKEKRLLSLQ